MSTITATTPIMDAIVNTPQLEVTDLIVKSLESALKRCMIDSVNKLATEYNFNADEALNNLNIDAAKLLKKSVAKGTGSSRATREKKIPRPFSCYEMPWIGCQALVNNHGLFTPCENKVSDDETYCTKCFAQTEKNSSGKPDHGTVDDRNEQGTEFKTPKGKKPEPYTRAIEKMGIDINTAATYIKNNFNIDIPANDLVVVPKSGRGRKAAPAKETASGDSDDIFSTVVATVASGNSKKKTTEDKRHDAELKESLKQKAAADKASKAIAKALAEQGKDVEQIISQGISEEFANEAIHNYAETIRKRKEAAEKRKAAKNGTTTTTTTTNSEILAAAKIEALDAFSTTTTPAPVAPVITAKPKAKVFSYTDGKKYIRNELGDIINMETQTTVGKYSGIYEEKTDITFVKMFTDDNIETENEEEVEEEYDE